MELAQSAETAAQSLKELRGERESGTPTFPPPQTEEVNQAKEQRTKSTLVCYRCDRAGHTVNNCKIDKDVECHQCGKRGHLRRACKNKQKSGRWKPRKRSKLVGKVGESRGRPRRGVKLR